MVLIDGEFDWLSVAGFIVKFSLFAGEDRITVFFVLHTRDDDFGTGRVNRLFE
jgi:hypothetical protein